MIQRKVVTQKPSPKKNITVKISDINIKHREKMFRSGRGDISRLFVGDLCCSYPTYIHISLLKAEHLLPQHLLTSF